MEGWEKACMEGVSWRPTGSKLVFADPWRDHAEAMGTDLGKQGKEQVNRRHRSGWGHRVRLYSLAVEGPGSGG